MGAVGAEPIDGANVDLAGVSHLRYSAFISYSHHDRGWASWLHRRIETYCIPKRLRGRSSPLGPLGARLQPVFRDRDELASSADLAAAVQLALAEAANLIVICSPAAARSRWVNEEIKAFVESGRRDRIFCLVVDGEPGASMRPAREDAIEAFPPALLKSGGEPLAADPRHNGDGRRDATLKILAGLLGVPFDELRQRELARRHRRLAILAAASAIGLVLTSALAIVALASRNEAIRQRDIARRRTLTAERTVDFVKSMFTVSDPSEAKGAAVSARQILERGRLQLENGLAEEPAVRADLGTTLGQVYLSLGLFKDGQALIERTFRGDHGDLAVRARQYAALGEAQADLGDYGRAEAEYRRALTLVRGLGDERTDLEPRLLVGIGAALTQAGGTKAAEPVLREALALDRRRGKSAMADVARDLEALSANAFAADMLDSAAALSRRALNIRIARQGPLHPAVSDDLNRLGAIAYLKRDNFAAAAYFERVLANDQIVLGPDHPDLGSTLSNLGRVTLEQRRYARAAELFRRSLGIALAQRSAEHPELAFTYANLALALRGLGKPAEAEALMVKARAVATATHHRNLAPILADTADMLCARGETGQGLALLQEARPIMAKTYPHDPWRIAWIDNVRAGCLYAAGDRTGARALLSASQGAIDVRWKADTLYGALAAERARRIG